MPRMTFIMPDGTPKEVDAPLGLSVMEIAQKHDIEQIEGACGGSLACATTFEPCRPYGTSKST